MPVLEEPDLPAQAGTAGFPKVVSRTSKRGESRHMSILGRATHFDPVSWSCGIGSVVGTVLAFEWSSPNWSAWTGPV